MTSHISVNVHCDQCDLDFVDVEARLEHVESSSSHPFCETCSRRFLNENSLSFHLKCAAPHLSSEDAEDEVLDGDETLLRWTSDIEEHLSYFNLLGLEDDYWSSESDADSNSSTSDWGNEPDSDHDHDSKFDNECIIVLVGREPSPEYRDLKFENFVNLSEIRASCYWYVMCASVPGADLEYLLHTALY
ncbi:hypothetical protein FB451DRAFT_1392881 [Mycena latifolia]|nr:hypothetical protein FB451DRAFT_1392881 [Mycena latifolia]